MSYLDWKVGDRVVCVDPAWGTTGPLQRACCPNLPENKGIYTIRTIETSVVVRGRDPETLIRLVEISNPIINGGEARFFASKFRKVVTRPTSIAVFERLLNPSDADTFRELEAEEFDYSDVVPFQ